MILAHGRLREEDLESEAKVVSKNRKLRLERAQWLRALYVLPEYLSSVPSTYFGYPTITCNSSAKRSDNPILTSVAPGHTSSID